MVGICGIFGGCCFWHEGKQGEGEAFDKSTHVETVGIQPSEAEERRPLLERHIAPEGYDSTRDRDGSVKSLVIIEKLGKGFFGSVWLGDVNGKTVVVKRLRNDKPHLHESISEEKVILEKLCNTTFYDRSGNSVKLPWFPDKYREWNVKGVIYFLTGYEVLIDLSSILIGKKDRPLWMTKDGIEGPIRQFSKDLAAFFDGSFIHRDITDRNTLVGVHGQIRLTDFGTAIDLKNSYPDNYTRVSFDYLVHCLQEYHQQKNPYNYSFTSMELPMTMGPKDLSVLLFLLDQWSCALLLEVIKYFSEGNISGKSFYDEIWGENWMCNKRIFNDPTCSTELYKINKKAKGIFDRYYVRSIESQHKAPESSFA